MAAQTTHGDRGLTESEARRLSWSALQIAAVPPGPWFIPAVVAIARLLVDGDAAAFRLSDVGANRTLMRHADPEGWLPALPDPRRMTIQLPSLPGTQRALSVWRRTGDFAGNDRLLLDCLRSHLVVAWNRCCPGADRLVEVDWSATPVLRLRIDARGGIERSAAAGPGQGDLLADWLRAPAAARTSDGGLFIAGDGSFLLTAPAIGVERAPEVHGWLLPRPEAAGSDMFLWSAGPLRGAVARGDIEPAPAQRPTVAQLDRVAHAWGLSPKQRLVVEELAAGKGNKEIADALGCAEVTVEYHLTAVRRKVGAIGRAALISRFWIDAHNAAAPARSAR